MEKFEEPKRWCLAGRVDISVQGNWWIGGKRES